MAQTTVSANRVPRAAPTEESPGISKQFAARFTAAPASSERSTAFSRPRGTSICNPITLVSPTSTSTGRMICIGSTAAA